MMKVCYSEMDTPAGLSCRLEADGHAGYAPAGQDIVCAGASTVMQGLVYLLAGEENAHSEAFDESDGPRLAVSVDAPCEEWVRGAFELAKACFVLLAERYPENVRFADVSRRGKESMMDLQLFAAEATAACGRNREPRLGQRPAEHECRSRHEVDAGSRNPWETFTLQLFAEGEAAPPALSEAQTRQAVASGTMKPDEAKVPAAPQASAEKTVELQPEKPRQELPVQRPELPPLSSFAQIPSWFRGYPVASGVTCSCSFCPCAVVLLDRMLTVCFSLTSAVCASIAASLTRPVPAAARVMVSVFPAVHCASSSLPLLVITPFHATFRFLPT